MIGTSSGKTIMATNKLLGRGTAGTGAIEELTLGTGLSLSGTTLNASGGVTSVSGTSPIASSGGATPDISIADAAADGTTKGAAAFTASDFNSASGVISIDYTNGQSASGSTKGFLTSADWTTFNNKQAALSAGTGISIASNTVTNTAPDQTVALTAGTGISVTGTYPSFTIANTAAGVSSVTATAPLTSTGGPTPVISTSMETSRLLGRTTAGTGVAEEISTAGTLTLTGGTLTGTGVGGSVGAVDNSVLRADVGTGIVQNSSIVIDDATTTTQNNVTIANAHAGQSDSSLVLSPKGTGALIAGPKPDGTSTGGNARGANAICLVTKRSAANQVAAGQDSIAIGTNARSSNQNSVSIGTNATAVGTLIYGSIAIGDTASSQALVTTAVGYYSNASADRASAIGGQGATASGQKSVAIGGLSTSASQTNSVAIGGESNQASASGAFVVGGSNNTASGTNSIALGERTLANRAAMLAQANGQFSAQGDAQRARFVLRCKTTTNTGVEMALDGSTTYLGIPSGKVIALTINISGVRSDGSAVAHYLRQYCVKNVGGTSSEVYAPITIGTDNAAGTTIALSANNGDDTLRILVTGVASQTWRWVAAVDAVEIAYGT